MKLGGIPRLYAAATMFAVTSVFVKLAAARLGGPMVSGVRFAVGILFCVVAIAVTGGGFRPKRPGIVLLRGLFGAASMILAYVAIGLTGPGRATVLGNTYPILVAVIAALVFGERIRPATIVSLAACALGAFVVVRDGSGASMLGDLAAIGGAIFAGFAVNFVRRASATDGPFMLYLAPCLFGLPALALGGGLSSAAIDPSGIWLALAAGVFAFCAQIMMALGYKLVPAGKGSVVFYFETALTMVFGVLLGERPNARFFAGLAFIALGLAVNTVATSKTVKEPG
ncbi:MAG: DMT family transporter [Spirochaetes bacterium]|nr:DMT family transporter [Spirochaetota bacterium]